MVIGKGTKRRMIGGGETPYIIAEIGVNHDGSAERAAALTRAAAEAGADAVKFQLFRADLLMSREAKLAAYQKAAGESDPVSMLRRLELNADAMGNAVSTAHRCGIHAIVSVFSIELVADAERIDWDAYKSASPDIVNRPLLESMARTGRPLIVSTGAAEMQEIETGLGWLTDLRDRGMLGVLQCVSSYPCPEPDASLGGIGALAAAFGLPTGYSDHTPSVDSGALAVAAGACILEKHLTYDRGAAGPDHAASLEPHQMREYVRLARRAHAMIGPHQKRLLPVEHDVRRVSRQSVTSSRAIRRGETLDRSNLTVKRPGTGVPAAQFESLVGRVAARDIECDTPLAAGDVA